jgi:hypothetical protein
MHFGDSTNEEVRRINSLASSIEQIQAVGTNDRAVKDFAELADDQILSLLTFDSSKPP